MKFLSEIPNVIAWDGALNKPIQFENGVYETKDPRIAALLKAMDFKHEGEELPEPETTEEPEPEPIPDIDYDAMTKQKIESILTKKGIQYSKRLTKDELVELLRGGD